MSSTESLAVEDIIFIVSFVAFSVAIGMIIYRVFGRLGWVDSFYNASMVLSGAGPVNELPTNTAKIMAGLYTLYSGIFFLILIAIIIARVIVLV